MSDSPHNINILALQRFAAFEGAHTEEEFAEFIAYFLQVSFNLYRNHEVIKHDYR